VTSLLFEEILSRVCERLTKEARNEIPRIAKNSDELESFVRGALIDEYTIQGITLTLEPKVQEFPDVIITPFGIEIKHTEKNTWVSIANSIRESHRPAGVERIYVVFGKYGGVPEVQWGVYENVVYHARTSHVPRFQIDMNADESIFKKLGISYVDFSVLPMKKKMAYMRTYAKSRRGLVKEFWWLEDDLVLFDSLSQFERRQVIAEACFLIPELITESPNSFARAALYLASIPRILSYKMLEDFQSMAINLQNLETGTKNGFSIMLELEQEILLASNNIIKGVVKDYWGIDLEIAERLPWFVKKLDEIYAVEPKPSKILFGGRFRSSS
jgi:hypothetical protein